MEKSKIEIAEEQFGPDDTSDAIPTSASDFVQADTDRPVADNRRPFEGDKIVPITGEPAKVSSVIGKGVEKAKVENRGRKKMSEQEKAEAKAKRDTLKAGKAPPSFADIAPGNKTAIGVGNSSVPIPARNYFNEACEIFIPISAIAGKMLGDHWGLAIDSQKGTIEFTEEQKMYVATMARWLEFEQFPPLNARYAFLVASVAYSAPKFHRDPTPERLKIVWVKVSGWWKRTFSGKKRK